MKVTVAQLKGSNFAEKDILKAGFSAQMLKTAGYDAARLVAAGLDLRELVQVALAIACFFPLPLPTTSSQYLWVVALSFGQLSRLLWWW